MGFRRLINFSVVGFMLAGLALPCVAQPSPQTTPTTTLQNDFVVTGNLWPEGNVTISGNLTVDGTTTLNAGHVFNVAPGTLGTSTTYNFTICPGLAGTVTKLNAGALTIPSASSDVTVQFFKDSLSNAMSGVYDYHSGTSGASAPVTITGNATLAATDIIICQIVTGSGLGGAVGVGASAELLANSQ
jgi:hypothetical protein